MTSLAQLRSEVGRRVSQRNRARLGQFIKAFRRRSAEAGAQVFALPLRLLPNGVTVVLRNALRPSGLLDYPGREIRLSLTSWTELDTRLHSCRKEPETIAWLKRVLTPRSVLYDVGANVGAYSLVAAAEMAGQGYVYALEPSYTTFTSLVENILLNDMQDCIVPLQVALADKTGMVSFHYASLEAGSARHGGVQSNGGSGTSSHSSHRLPAFRLDDLITMLGIQAPTCMKIDVDGGEASVLAGAERTLRSPQLRDLLVEVDEEETDPRRIHSMLAAAGFVVCSQHRRGSGTTWNWIWSKPSHD